MALSFIKRYFRSLSRLHFTARHSYLTISEFISFLFAVTFYGTKGLVPASKLYMLDQSQVINRNQKAVSVHILAEKGTELGKGGNFGIWMVRLTRIEMHRRFDVDTSTPPVAHLLSLLFSISTAPEAVCRADYSWYREHVRFALWLNQLYTSGRRFDAGCLWERENAHISIGGSLRSVLHLEWELKLFPLPVIQMEWPVANEFFQRSYPSSILDVLVIPVW